MNKQNWLMLGIILVLVAMPLTVQAFGITSAYYSGNSLKLQPGETKTVTFGLSNMGGDQNLTIIANITKGAEIAQLIDPAKQYSVPLGTNNNVGVSLTVTAPIDATIGKEYEVEVTVTTITLGSGGGVILGQSIGKSIPITIVSPIVSPTGATSQKSNNTELIILIVLIVIIAAAIIFVILSMKKKKK